MKKKLMLASIAATMGMAGFMGAGLANAQGQPGHQSALVDKIASKFNLNKDDVQKVFDEQHQEIETEHQQKFKDRLDQAVEDGKLTQDQEDKLIAKFKENQTFMESLKDKNPDERRSAMKTHFEVLKKWAADNNISKNFLLGPGYIDHGMRKGGMH